MCGINGIVFSRQAKGLDKRIQKMNVSINHRGPDSNGVVPLTTNSVFGHCRLSILDVDKRASQPMQDASGRWTIVFNGEIYNYKELSNDVSYRFNTKSDTEVILAYVEQYGIEKFLSKSNGMFAIALYDKHNHELWIARDRLGIKPFYYYMDSENFIFSSEVKGILNSGLVEAEFNEAAIDEYLGHRYVRAPFTFFKNIYQLEPGHYARIDSQLSFKTFKYWELPSQFNTSISYDEHSLLEEFGRRVERAIDYRLISDVPLGTYLSGGIDSSLISAIAATKTKGALNTYTIGFQTLNEFPYAKLVAEQYHTNHHAILMEDADYFGTMNEVITYKDAPLGVPNELLLAKMSKVLKKDITVVLSGEGADELMGGYGKIFRSPFDYANIKPEVDFYTYFIEKYEYVPREIRNMYLTTSHELRDKFDFKVRKEFEGCPNEENVFRFFHNYHVKGLLQRVDTTTMLAGVEARVPFLDHTLVEFSYKEIPYGLKLHWNSAKDKIGAQYEIADDYSEKRDIPKYLLREVARNWIPNEIVDRIKMGFPVPLNDWKQKLMNQAEVSLKGAYWLNQKHLQEFILDSGKQKRAGQILWMFLNVEQFRRIYFEREWRY